MKKMKCILLLLCLLMIVQSYTGCTKEATTSSIMENYYKENAENWPEVWLYGLDITFINGYLERYNSSASEQEKLKIVKYSDTELDIEQFEKKLQTAIMAGNGPDFVLTCNMDLFDDPYKFIKAGALQSLDDIISDWNDEAVYFSILDGLRHSDGKLYFLPMGISPNIIITTKQNLACCGLLEEDFDHLEILTDKSIAYWESEEVTAAINTTIGFDSFPLLYESTSPLISVTDDAFQNLIEKRNHINSYYKAWNSKQSNMQSEGWLEAVLNGKQIFTMSSLSVFYESYGGLTEQQQEEIVLLPVCDINGKMVGNVEMFAFIPAQAENMDVIKKFLDYMLSCTGSELSYKKSSVINHMKSHYLNEQEITKLYPQVEQLLQHQMRLTIFRYTTVSYMQDFTACCNGQKDWEELERSINIYLSE